MLQFLVFFVLLVLAFFVDLEEAVELLHATGGAEDIRSLALALGAMSMVVWSNTAGFICDATKRIQISR